MQKFLFNTTSIFPDQMPRSAASDLWIYSFKGPFGAERKNRKRKETRCFQRYQLGLLKTWHPCVCVHNLLDGSVQLKALLLKIKLSSKDAQQTNILTHRLNPENYWFPANITEQNTIGNKHIDVINCLASSKRVHNLKLPSNDCL